MTRTRYPERLQDSPADVGPIRDSLPDPLGPEGIYGMGRCDTCGESFQENDEMAEVVPAEKPEGCPTSDHLTIHVGCMKEDDRLA